MEQPKITNDPENYYTLSKPFEGPEAANEAIEKFYEELGALRKKYKIPDLLAVVYASTKYPDGKIGSFMNHIGFGNSLHQSVMAAFAYGQTQAEHRELINKTIDVGKTTNR